MWLAAIMAKCHKAIWACRGAHRNHSDLSALGLPSTFQSHTNSSLQVSFFFFFGLFVLLVPPLTPHPPPGGLQSRKEEGRPNTFIRS